MYLGGEQGLEQTWEKTGGMARKVQGIVLGYRIGNVDIPSKFERLERARESVPTSDVPYLGYSPTLYGRVFGTLACAPEIYSS